MSFTIRQTQEHGLDLINIEDESNGTVISLLPGFGASLHAFIVRTAGRFTFNVIDGYADRNELKRELARSFKGSKALALSLPDQGREIQIRGQNLYFLPAVWGRDSDPWVNLR